MFVSTAAEMVNVASKLHHTGVLYPGEELVNQFMGILMLGVYAVIGAAVVAVILGICYILFRLFFSERGTTNIRTDKHKRSH